MDVPKKTFYFFSSRTAIRYHISRRLLALGWEAASRPTDALFGDPHLVLNDEISKNLEYKHLLWQLVSHASPSIMPLSYYINEQNSGDVFAKIIYEHYIKEGTYVKNVDELKWILKPSMLNNADEIRLFNNIEELKKHYASTQRLGGDHILQRYIPNPALLEGRKYTFRLPVILTNYMGVLIYREGYINISAYPFNLEDNFVNKKVHLTNYVIDGELAQIEQRMIHSLEDNKDIFQQMERIVQTVIKMLIKKAPNYLKPGKNKIFEIFGFDFIRDQEGKIWLLEINQGPDAPTFEDNYLNSILWDKFWEDIIDDFVLPIALNIKPKRHFERLIKVMEAKEGYSIWYDWWHHLTKQKQDSLS